MSIKMKRNTGMMGGTMKVSLSVDGQNVHKLSNNESYRIDSNKNTTKIKATQWFLEVRKRKLKIHPA
ncbi:hypothetical protein [Oceanobacillus locisalsi]|uniref:hypothetical protein n=1 Tax=Oceanobacillus locisalsi TaxID=546107 RepID=UPI0036D24A67